MKNFKLGLAIAGVVTTTAAHAVTFGSAAIVNGTSYTIGAAPGLNGIGVQKIGDTLSFALPNSVAINTTKTVTISYSVFADSGFLLDSIKQIAGNGIATGTSSVGISTNFLEGSFTETAPVVNYGSGSAFQPVNYSFTNKLPKWSTVTTTINLTGTGGFAKVSTYSADYTQAVPEPMTMGALACGLIGFAARRRGNKK
jgi:hypothetical protein